MANMKPINSFVHNAQLKQELQFNLDNFGGQRQVLDDHRYAAVVVTVFNSGNEAAIIVTRRSAKLKEHSGQWAMPGGRIDAGETTIEAALRELEEEINLTATEQQVIGMLDDYVTRSGYIITPVVVWTECNEDDLHPNPGEVASIHAFTFSELNREDSPNLESIPQSDRQVLSMNYLDDVIYAPTAAMLYQFREVALRGLPTRVLNYDQPLFAWR